MAEPGWHPNPDGDPTTLRWWDGNAWTTHTRPATAPPSPAPQQVSNPPQPLTPQPVPQQYGQGFSPAPQSSQFNPGYEPHYADPYAAQQPTQPYGNQPGGQYGNQYGNQYDQGFSAQPQSLTDSGRNSKKSQSKVSLPSARLGTALSALRSLKKSTIALVVGVVLILLALLSHHPSTPAKAPAPAPSSTSHASNSATEGGASYRF